MSSLAQAPLVGPVLGLAAWTFVMEIWLYSYRIPDITTYKIKVSPTTSRSDLEKIPAHRRWPSDNFAHLHEQPTVFYAVALGSAVLGIEDRGSVGLAWAYVGMRVVHSLIQCRGNVIMRRWQAFVLSSVLLAGMTARAGVAMVL